MEITIYHNPKCSKSRQTLELLNERDLNPTVIEYLTNPPSHQQLDSLLRGLEMEPRDFMRRGETEYAEQNLDDESLSRDQLIAAMISCNNEFIDEHFNCVLQPAWLNQKNGAFDWSRCGIS